MNRLVLSLAFLSSVFFPAFAQTPASLPGAPPPAPAPVLENQSQNWAPPTFSAPPNAGAGISRTLHLLQTSTPQKRNRVRILFYGQSITEQKWSHALADSLRKQFPHADLQIENRAIGGFASQLLSKSAEQDLFPFYPNLLIFHVYGSHLDYEKIIENVRKRTTAEILLTSDHPTKPEDLSEATDPARLSMKNWHAWWNAVFLPETARKWGAELADVRTPWKELLQRENRAPSFFLADGVHLNERGNALMEAILKPYFTLNPALPLEEKGIRTIPVSPDDWKDGRLKIPFSGNRVDAIFESGLEKAGALVEVSIDGKKPSQIPGTVHFTRPSIGHSTWVPAILKIGSRAPLVPEEWTATITKTSPEKIVEFSLRGSETGEDGTGHSDAEFVSPSGRVVIEKGDWFTDFSKEPMPVGFQVKWSSRAQSLDRLTVPASPDPSRENSLTLAQGFENGPHTLELFSPDGERPPLVALRFFEPMKPK